MHKLNMVLMTVGMAALPLVGQGPMRSDASQNLPAASWDAQDPADPIWRAGREAINASDWNRAAEQFKRIRTENGFRNSTYRGQSYYWEAYARAQMGGSSQLRLARTLLEDMRRDFAEDAKKIRDVGSLLSSVEGRLSKEYGDKDASRNLREEAKGLSNGCPDLDDDDNPRAAALNALLQVDSDAAMPILEQILTKREKCSEGMRAKAVWLIAQKKSPRAADILLEVAKSDPSEEVQGQAVFWLSQVDSDKAIGALESILRSNAQSSLHENALFAVSQNRSPRAAQILREFAGR
jgi:hypothetical protein